MATLSDDDRAALRAYVDDLLAHEPDLTDDELADLRRIIRPTLTPPAPGPRRPTGRRNHESAGGTPTPGA
jgi:hypothetical protein